MHSGRAALARRDRTRTRGSNRELSVFEPAFRGPSFFEIVVGRQLMGDESVADKPRT
jgi:hypothetical protein